MPCNVSSVQVALVWAAVWRIAQLLPIHSPKGGESGLASAAITSAFASGRFIDCLSVERMRRIRSWRTLFTSISAANTAGLAILLGIFLRPAALVLAVIMIGAIVMKIALLKLPYAASDSVGWELDAILLGAALVLATVGGGKLVVKKG